MYWTSPVSPGRPPRRSPWRYGETLDRGSATSLFYLHRLAATEGAAGEVQVSFGEGGGGALSFCLHARHGMASRRTTWLPWIAWGEPKVARGLRTHKVTLHDAAALGSGRCSPPELVLLGGAPFL